METTNSKIGLTLFGLYLLVYSAFVLLNAFSPTTMEALPIAGVNLAILYGFALIVLAFVLAAVYGWYCRAVAANNSADSSKREGRGA